MKSESRSRIGRTRAGFTLVELLVVVSIIALLIAVLLPSLSKARKQAKAVVCQTNVRSLSTAALTYASEWGVYPPTISNFSGSGGKNWEGGIDWLGVGDQGGPYQEGDPMDPQSGTPKGFTAAPRFGVLFPLIKEEKAYLCPDDKPGNHVKDTKVIGMGNGKFSYTMFANMGLRPPERIPARRQELSGGSRGGPKLGKRLSKRSQAQTPIFVEEHPDGINGLTDPNAHMEGNFNYSRDHVVSRHPSFEKRKGYHPSSPNAVTSFLQGRTNIGFADGHVAPVPTNFKFGSREIKPTNVGGLGLEGVPTSAEGLLYYYGIEYDEIKATD